MWIIFKITETIYKIDIILYLTINNHKAKMVANIRMIINSSVNTQTKIHTGLLLLLFLIKQTVNFMWEKSKQEKPGKFWKQRVMTVGYYFRY